MAYIITSYTKFKSIAIILVCLMALNMQGQTANKDTKIGELTFNTKVIDYGKIEHNANGERQFTFKNTGNAPVVISNVKTSCGCTVPTYPKTAILPGKSETITVKYATNRIGRFSKSITVISNAKNPTQILKIKGEVLKTNL